MLSTMYVFKKKGDVSGVYGLLPKSPLINSSDLKENKTINRQAILNYFRYDREEGTCGPLWPDKNPSKDPKDIDFYYHPVYYRQRIASKIPYKISDTVTLIDVFTCLGSRFGLESLQVFVEVYESSCGSERIWANIYYVADSEVPACIIEVNEFTIYVD